MSALSRNLRQALEKTVRKARAAAESGAGKALESLAVDRREPWESMTPDVRALRNRLRAHGRNLGDRRDPRSGAQETGRLMRECAYEHWHRMLFARFLAEAGLLIEPEIGVAVTLDEAKELARDRGGDWLTLASTWAGQMLPQIFRDNDPVLDIALPPETRIELEALLEGLPHAAFLADDSLGWVYQFWQADRKEAVNSSGVKIGADELPAVTQLFTEDYMVLFLLHNTLGAWWAGKMLAERPNLAQSAASEEELREACRVGGVEWTYLRFVRQEGEGGAPGQWRPAAGTYPGWPRAAKDVTLCDPCMGSGHFLVFALPILAALRMVEEGLSEEAATDAVLRDNLFGLEIDPRCTQIAAFNLAFAAWRMAGYRRLPALNVACSGLAVGASKAEWLRLAEKVSAAADPDAARDLFGAEETLLTVGIEKRVRNGLEALHDLFAAAPSLGSLIDPRRAGGDILTAGFEALEPLLRPVLAAAESDETAEMAVAAQGMAKAAELLGWRFTLVVTNVPFLGRGKQHEVIQSHLAAYFDDAKRDLATAMFRRLLGFVGTDGTVAAVTPQNWLFLSAYVRLRERVLRETTLNIVAMLGPRAFETISGEVVNTALVTLTATSAQPGADFAGRSLDDWLRDGFFVQHCKLFHHRPFVWHVWDGRRDGFHALVNCHRLAGPGGEGRRTLEKLIWSCLGSWIDRQSAERDAETEGADARLAHAEHLRSELVKVLEGAPPYDLFARWKPLHEQPVGWEPDMNDGVRVNIRPFTAARPLGAKARNACILRMTPNIHWRKDRGKEPARDKADYPWFWSRDPENPTHKVDFPGGPDFDGNRWNDPHYTRAAKEAARARAAEGKG